MTTREEIFEDVISESLEVNGGFLTPGQIKALAKDITSAHEGMDAAFPGPPPAPHDDESKPRSRQEIIHRLKNPDENFWKDGVAEQAAALLEKGAA